MLVKTYATPKGHYIDVCPGCQKNIDEENIVEKEHEIEGECDICGAY